MGASGHRDAAADAVPLDRLMRLLLVLSLALMHLGCFNDSLRRTMLPNGYSFDTMGRRSGIIVRPHSPRSGGFSMVWPPLNGESERCGAFGWREAWVVCEVVTYEQGNERPTGAFVVVNTSDGAVTVVPDRSRAIALLGRASIEMPALARDHPTTEAIYFPE